MFEKLFGSTEEIQIRYLQPRAIITVVSLVAFVVLLISTGEAENIALIALAILAFVWGWSAVRGLFGVTSIGILFSRNVVFASILFVIYAVISYLFGIFVGIIGVGRYAYLILKNQKTGGKYGRI